VWDFRNKQTLRLVPVLGEFLTGAHKLLTEVCGARNVALEAMPNTGD